ncbi:hypothetical protein RCS94_06480 [Orbaceae bacterium ac157xtp]
MALQKSVGTTLPIAVVGDFASNNPRTNAVNNNGGFKSDGTVKVGTFCWATGNDLSLTGTGKPLGFVARNGASALIQIFDSSTLTINKGFETTVFTRGDFYAQVDADVSIGQKVFVSTTDGKIKGDVAGATIAGYEETEFKFSTTSPAGGLAIISN